MIKGRSLIRDTDKGWAKILGLAKALKESGMQAKAGVMGDSEKAWRPGSQANNVDIAVFHEFGAPGANLPARSFIREPFEASRAQLVGIMGALMARVYAGKGSTENVLGIVGAKMAAAMKNAIKAGLKPDTTEETTARKRAKSYRGAAKGDPKPLVDTGQLLNAITWAVTRGRE